MTPLVFPFVPLAASVRALSTMDMPNSKEIDATVIVIGKVDAKQFNNANESQETLNKMLIELVDKAAPRVIQLLNQSTELLKYELKVRGLDYD